MNQKAQKLFAYEEFVDKFKPKKTTDDCYTPPTVYDAVRRHVDENIMSLEGKNVIRPFYPGGDYEGYDYQPDDVVVDNPPFSMLARIVDFYLARGIRFFLFAPHLVLFNYASRRGVTAVVVGNSIVYENKASIPTSYLTNMYADSPAFVVDGVLFASVEDAVKSLSEKRKHKAYKLPPTVVSVGTLGKVAKKGLTLKVGRESAHKIRGLNCGHDIYGTGFLVSRTVAKRIEEAEAVRVLKEETSPIVFSLDANEEAIIESLE